MTAQATKAQQKMHPTKIDLPQSAREAVINELQARLVDSIDLLLQLKQAHWNVKGPRFIALHELFDKVHAAVEGHVDELAERISILGGTVHGTVRDAAAMSSLKEYPHDIFDGTKHCQAVATALADFGKKVRASIEVAGDQGDANSEDLFTEVSRDIDQWLWFVEAHIQAKD